MQCECNVKANAISAREVSLIVWVKIRDSAAPWVCPRAFIVMLAHGSTASSASALYEVMYEWHGCHLGWLAMIDTLID